MTDAVTESYKIIDMAKKMNGEESVMPKNNSRYHFEMPGSVQGWKVETKNNLNPFSLNYVLRNIQRKFSILLSLSVNTT